MPAAAPPETKTGYPIYLFVHGLWFLTFGLQMVLFPYLVRVVLGGSEEMLGIAQMSINLPTTLLILIGGLVADRVDQRRHMVRLYAICAMPFAVMGALVGLGLLSYGKLILYALTVGTIGAFLMPARDSLLSDVAPLGERRSLQSAVTETSLAQFTGQIAGMALAASAALTGVVSLILLQAGLMAVAALAALRLRPRPRAAKTDRGEVPVLRFALDQISGGVEAVRGSTIIFPLSVLSIAIGVCFMGSFMVLMPLLVQGYFPADLAPAERARVASALGLFSLCFWAGSIITTFVMMRFGVPARRGLALLFSMAMGGLMVLACALPVPFAVLCLFNFVWGLAGGVAMNLSRALVQEAAAPALRGRIISVYTLGFMGGGPIGALLWGFLAGAIGPNSAVMVPGLLMIATVALIGWNSCLRHIGGADCPMERERRSGAAEPAAA